MATVYDRPLRDPAMRHSAGRAGIFTKRAKVTTRLREVLGPEAVVEIPPKMVFEDFAEFARSGVPSVLISVGAVEPEKFAEAQKSGTVLPGTHSSLWAPDYGRAIPVAVKAETTMLLQAFQR
jgi:hippurate hydrolase